jgi:predicted metal-binding protein
MQRLPKEVRILLDFYQQTAIFNCKGMKAFRSYKKRMTVMMIKKMKELRRKGKIYAGDIIDNYSRIMDTISRI